MTHDELLKEAVNRVQLWHPGVNKVFVRAPGYYGEYSFRSQGYQEPFVTRDQWLKAKGEGV